MTYANIYYFKRISAMGGIETFLNELAMKYKDIDLTIVYKEAAPEQLKRLKKLVRCIKYTGQTIKCEKAFFNYNIDIIDKVEAKEYTLMIHSDYMAMDKLIVPEHPKLNRWVAVSRLAAENFTKKTGKKCEVCYNPFAGGAVKPAIKLVSATRLTNEKGWERMKELSKALDAKGVAYQWLIYTDSPKDYYNPNIIFLEPRLDIAPQVAAADYLVQLSDCESYCYSVVEALSYGVPVITTPLPVLKELGVNETNSITLAFDLSNMDEVVRKMRLRKAKFKYEAPVDRWNELLVAAPSTYAQDMKKIYEVEVIHKFEDTKNGNKQRLVGETFKATLARIEEINEAYIQPLVKIKEEE